VNSDDYYQLGHIVKTHGLAGDVVVHLDVSFPSSYSKLDLLFIKKDGQLIPHFIKKIQISQDKARISLDEIFTKDAADLIVGKEVYLPLKYLPKLKAGEYYYHDLIDFEVISNDMVLGRVAKIYDLGTQHLFSVLIDGIEAMIPFNEHIIKEVDLENRKIVVELPDGLIDIYTG